MKLVGPLRLRTYHTTSNDDCPLKTPLDKCHYRTSGEEESAKTFRGDAGGVPFMTCAETNVTERISGEQGTFPCFGYLVQIPSNSTPRQFQDKLTERKDLLFGTPARGLAIECTLYLPRADWWVHARVLYEYGLQGEQVLSTPKLAFSPFRLNTYQLLRHSGHLGGRPVPQEQLVIFIFDTVKMALYFLYFGVLLC